MLGPFDARHGGRSVDLGDLQQRYALVVLLLHANRPVSTERLIDIVWGTNRPRTNIVPGYIAKIRRMFREVGASDVSIETTATGYVLHVDPERLDMVRFARLCEEAAAARRTGDGAGAARLLHEAVELWRGRFLEDLDIDRIGGNEVVSLDDALIDALGDLAELELVAGHYRWVRDRLRPVVRSDPSRQRLAGLLMRALIANGDRVEAVKVYHLAREALVEYGMETSADLRGLARLAQYGEPRSSLPPRLARFTGRTEELAAIEAIARSAEQRTLGVVWLSGMPGVGKTALALEVAHRLRDRFIDARLFVALNGFTPNVEPTTPTEALARLLLDLGVPAERIPPTMSGRVALYQDKLAGTRTLVVLDNVRSEDQVRPLLPDDPGCLAIVTSRKSGDLETGENIRLAPLPPQDAADLFRGLVGGQRLRGRSTEVAEVVRRCGWLPLQIRVVAAQFRRHDRWPIEHLVRLLTDIGPWRANTGFDAEGAVACLASYQQLNDQQRTLFRLFGLIPGQDLSVHAAAALAHCDLPRARALLDDLHAVSLLEETTPERYHILDPLKDFATSVLPPASQHEAQEAIERLLDFYLVTASAAIATAFPFDRIQQPAGDRLCPVAPAFPDQHTALEWLSTERSNLVAAITYAASHQCRVHTWQLAVLLWRYFYTTGHIEDWTQTLELARQAVMAEPTNRYGQAHVLLRLSAAHWRSGRLTHAIELAAQALPRWVHLGDTRGEADALCAIAVPTMELGNHDQAIAHFQTALAKYQEINDQRGQANALSILGLLNERHGNLTTAQRHNLAVVPLLREIGHTQGLAHALNNLGSVQQGLGLLDEAITNHQEARALARQIGDRSLEAYALNYLGTAHRRGNRLDQAAHHQEQARTVANNVADTSLWTQLYLDHGATCQARGDQQAALRAYRAALDLANATGDRAKQAHANRGIAQTLHTTGHHDQATEHWQTAQTAFTELNLPEAREIKRERELPDYDCASQHGTLPI